MACSCQGRVDQEFVWTGTDGSEIIYASDVQARAKVIRSGGTYVARVKS